MAKVTIDLGAVNRATESAFKETCFLLGIEFTKAISEPIWQWDNAPSPRDIVDTGQLRASQQVEFVSDSEAQFSWNVEYALYVHEGYQLRNGREVSGRPWTTKGLKRFNPQKVFETLLAAKLK